jgi:hypothetical protein
MEASDSPRARPASSDTAEPHEPEQQGAGQQQSPTSLDPRLWPRPYVDQPAGGPRSGPVMMPRYTRADQADTPQAAPAGARPVALPARRQLPAAALPPGRPSVPAALPPGRPSVPAAPPAGRAPVPPPPAVSRSARPQPVRAVIGDEIRIPFIWCEFGTCDATYTHPDALGERDLRDRALAAGWRYDALGRRACPSCAQHDPTFWPARPPAPVGGDWRRAG